MRMLRDEYSRTAEQIIWFWIECKGQSPDQGHSPSLFFLTAAGHSPASHPAAKPHRAGSSSGARGGRIVRPQRRGQAVGARVGGPSGRIERGQAVGERVGGPSGRSDGVQAVGARVGGSFRPQGRVQAVVQRVGGSSGRSDGVQSSRCKGWIFQGAATAASSRCNVGGNIHENISWD